MHPSKVHQSTTKQPDSGLRLGFMDAAPNTEPTQKRKPMTFTHDTPTKSKGTLMSSPGFEFKFTRPDTDLSVEAQKIMENVREEAAKIKAEIVAQRNEQDRKGSDAETLFGVGGRKIAKAKGKAGRYSHVHMQEFKKMDSIAGHASAWKAHQGRFQPVQASLKRSKSKAGLNDRDTEPSRTKNLHATTFARGDDRLENTAPSKRARQLHHQDTSSARPESRDSRHEGESNQSAPKLLTTNSSLPAAVTTPTKASLARASSVKHSKTSMMPSLVRFNSTKTMNSLAAPRTEGSNKYFSSLSRFGSMKSILHRSRPLFSNDPVKVAAGTHLPTPQGKSDLDKALPILPGTPSGDLQRSSTLKRVDFTPSTISRYELAAASPSPSKIPAPHTVARFESLEPTVRYPSLPQLPSSNSSPLKQTGRGHFTFEATKTIKFDPVTVGDKSTTIRHIRPSDFPTTSMTPFEDLPVVPHGMPNKKRRREDSDDEAIENKYVHDDEGGEPRSKRTEAGNEGTAQASSDEKKNFSKRRMTGMPSGSKIPRPGGGFKGKGRGILSLSRLNMLARPKERR